MRFTARLFSVLSQKTTAFNFAAFTFVASFALTLVAMAAGVAGVAIVVNFGVMMGCFLADNWEAGTAAAWNINSTTGSGRSSAHDKAISLIVITIPVIDPALAVCTTALMSQGSGLKEVVGVDVS